MTETQQNHFACNKGIWRKSYVKLWCRKKLCTWMWKRTECRMCGRLWKYVFPCLQKLQQLNTRKHLKLARNQCQGISKVFNILLWYWTWLINAYDVLSWTERKNNDQWVWWCVWLIHLNSQIYFFIISSSATFKQENLFFLFFWRGKLPKYRQSPILTRNPNPFLALQLLCCRLVFTLKIK